jgi:transposase
MDTLYVALDIGSKSNSVVFTNQSGEILHRYKKIPNNLPSLNVVWNQAMAIFNDYDFTNVLFGLESSGPYWFGLYWELQSKCSSFDPEHFKVHALNAQIVAGFKSKFPIKKQKTDRKDALTINRRMRFGEYEPSYLPKGDLLALRFYTRQRLHLILSMVKEKARFLSTLFLKFSEYKKTVKDMNLFYNVFGKCSTALAVKYPSCDALAKVSISELASLLESVDPTNVALRTIEKKYDLIKLIASNSYPMPQEAIEPINFVISQTFQNINFFSKQIKEIELKISTLMENIEDPAKSIKGLGPVYSAGIIAETPNPKIFHYKKGHASLASYLGIIPSMNDSGEFKSIHNKMTKMGNPYGRYYYIESARTLAQHNPTFKQYYQRKIKESHPRRHKRVIGLVARKFIRVYYHLKVNNLAFRYI